MMKRFFGFALAIALLLSLAPALAEISWNPWVLENTLYWTRTGSDPEKPDIQYSEEAYGETLEELKISAHVETRTDGASTFITGTYYHLDGVTIEQIVEKAVLDGYPTQTLVRSYHHQDGIHSSTELFVYEDGDLTLMEREQYDTLGNLQQITMRSYDSQGRRLEDVFYSPDEKHTMTTSYEYLENEEYVATSTLPDGSLVSRQATLFVKEDEQGRKLFRNVILESYDSARDLITLSEINPDGSILERSLLKTDSGGITTYTQLFAEGEESDIRLSYLYTKYDRFGNFIEGSVYDPETGAYVETSRAPENDLLRDEWLKNNPPPQAEIAKPSYVWYPSNTVTTAGFAFRDERPELTKKWYQFTPVDLSRDGSYSFEMVGGSVYILGKVVVDVKGDEVTVRYATTYGRHGNVRMESEFFTFFPDLASVSAVEPEELGEGFRFGEPISIEKDLNGDTRVLLFVRNVATFADHVRSDMPRARYWPNHPTRVAHRELLRGLMD